MPRPDRLPSPARKQRKKLDVREIGTSEASKILHVSKQRVHYYIKKGMLRSRKINPQLTLVMKIDVLKLREMMFDNPKCNLYRADWE